MHPDAEYLPVVGTGTNYDADKPMAPWQNVPTGKPRFESRRPMDVWDHQELNYRYDNYDSFPPPSPLPFPPGPFYAVTDQQSKYQRLLVQGFPDSSQREILHLVPGTYPQLYGRDQWTFELVGPDRYRIRNTVTKEYICARYDKDAKTINQGYLQMKAHPVGPEAKWTVVQVPDPRYPYLFVITNTQFNQGFLYTERAVQDPIITELDPLVVALLPEMEKPGVLALFFAFVPVS